MNDCCGKGVQKCVLCWEVFKGPLIRGSTVYCNDILTCPFSNKSSKIVDFLSHLTLKSKAEKDRFFHGLARDLFSLPPEVIAEHIVPLVINPLVMAEPVAKDCLWKHLLLPASDACPRPKMFDDSHPCPLLEKDMFK